MMAQKTKIVRPSEASLAGSFGLHLMLEAYGGEPNKLYDYQLVFDLLAALPSKIGMAPIGLPHVVRIDQEPITGLSGFIFIVTSHISIHTFVRKRFLTLDVYSCKHFDAAAVVAEVVAAFEVEQVEESLLVRGRSFAESGDGAPDVPREAGGGWRADRDGS